MEKNREKTRLYKHTCGTVTKFSRYFQPLLMKMDGSREIPQQLMDVANFKLRDKIKYEKILSLFSASRDGNVWVSRNSPVNKGRS